MGCFCPQALSQTLWAEVRPSLPGRAVPTASHLPGSGPWGCIWGPQLACALLAHLAQSERRMPLFLQQIYDPAGGARGKSRGMTGTQNSDGLPHTPAPPGGVGRTFWARPRGSPPPCERQSWAPHPGCLAPPPPHGMGSRHLMSLQSTGSRASGNRRPEVRQPSRVLGSRWVAAGEAMQGSVAESKGPEPPA